MPCSLRTLPCTGDHRSSCSDVGVFPSAGQCPGEVPVPLLCTSPWDDLQGTSSGSTPMCLNRTGPPVPQVRPSQGRYSGRLSLRFVLVPCGKGNQKIFLSKAKKARIVRQGHFSLYIHMPHGVTSTVTRCIGTHFFSLFHALQPTEHGGPSRASQGEVTFADRKKKNYPISSFTICFTTFIFTLDASALS